MTSPTPDEATPALAAVPQVTPERIAVVEASLRQLHAEEMFGDCVEDGDPWPCKTVRMLNGLHL